MAPNSDAKSASAPEKTQSISTESTSSSTSTPNPPSSAAFSYSPKTLANDAARTGFDPQTKWWINYFRVLSGKMTPEGMLHFRESQNRINEARDCRRCEENRDWVLAYSPVVRFLREKVADLNGRLDASNVVCRRCPSRVEMDADGNPVVTRQSGGFSPDHGILLCANEIHSRKHLEDTLAHEMVHVWDHLRWKVDWESKKDLKHVACAEIRASMLSGECRWTREMLSRGHWTLTQQFQNCVRRRAIESVSTRPRCKNKAQAAEVVDQVWDSCFADTRPFDEVYR